MAEAGLTLRRKLPEIAVEAAMVVFAVLVAFGVDEWRETRQLRQFAAAARSAVETELAENLAEFRATQPALMTLTEQLEAALELAYQALRENRTGLDATPNLDIRLPRTSTAAWRVAQGSQAAPYFDYDWLIQVSQIYELYDGYVDVRQQVASDVGRLLAREGAFRYEMTPTDLVEVVEPLRGNMRMLSVLHGEMQRGLETLVE